MAKVGFIFFAEEVFNSNPHGNELMVKNPKIALIPEFIPGQFSFFVVFSLLDLTEGQKYNLEINFKHVASGEIILENSNIHFDYVKDNSKLVNSLINGAVVNLHMNNIVIKQEGAYEMVIKIDGNASSQSIDILKGNRE